MIGAYRSIITWFGVAALAAMVLACQETTPVTPAAPAPEVPDPPMPTLVGTWEQVTEWDDDDGDIRPVTIRLVFTESGKAFWHVDQLELSGEDRHDPYGHIADWSATEDTITKTFFHDNDDDNQWESGTIDKSYYLTDAGSVLFVHDWGSDEAEDAFERYTRVQDRVPPNPTLLGTWEFVGVYHEHDDVVDDYVVAGKKINTLTFTENRYILVETRRDGEIDYGASSGKWTPATETSVTKTFVAERHQDEDGNWTTERRSFDKEHAWGAGGDLFIAEWRGDGEDEGEAAAPYVERYTRVESPLPSLEGIWVWRAEWERDDGQIGSARVTLTIGETLTYLWEQELGGEFHFSYSVSGSWRHDESKQFVIFDMPDAEITHSEWPSERVDSWTREHKGHPLPLAYASAGVPDQMMISSWHREQDYDANTNTRPDSEEYPYGGYYRAYVKQP